MKELKVKDVLQVCNGKMIMGNEEEVLENFSQDTREIQNGDVYIGIKGENFDGNQFYEVALETGAKVCILENIQIKETIKEKYQDATIILVDNTVKALKQLAAYKRSFYNIPVIAVTGSVGKTSTKDILASIVSKKYKVLKTEGNKNNQIGLPLTILKLKDHTAMVIEMGMSELGEIHTLSDIAKPTISIITNVGTAHIGNLGSRQNILKAKLEILDGMKKDGILVVNNDNDMLHHWQEENTTYSVATFGMENKSDVMAKEVNLQEFASQFIAITKKEELKVEVPIGGQHFVYNALCAITVGQLLKIPNQDILMGIQEFKLTKNRMDIRKNKNNVTIINDCYNANYDSMKAALEYLSKMHAKRKIAVLGDMLELGKYSKSLHEKVGNAVVTNKIDLLVTVGTEVNYIIEQAQKLGMKQENIFHFKTTKEVIKFLETVLAPEDAVLIKASNGMHFQEIVEKTII